VGAAGAAQVEQLDGAIVVDVDDRVEIGKGIILDAQHRRWSTTNGDAFCGEVLTEQVLIAVVNFEAEGQLSGRGICHEMHPRLKGTFGQLPNALRVRWREDRE
jgi:hypothetical protein